MSTYYLDMPLRQPEWSELHMTLVQWFDTSRELAEVIELLSLNFDRLRTKKINILSKGAALYGPHLNVPVHEIEMTECLRRLHSSAVECIQGSIGGRILNPEWAHAGYHPHISDRKGQQFVTGSQTLLSQVRLMVPEPKDGVPDRGVYTWTLAPDL